MLKTKTITANNTMDLDRKISTELMYRIPSSNVTDIKFATNCVGEDYQTSYTEYCAMIIYR